MAHDDEALVIARRVVTAWREDPSMGHDRYELLAIHIAGALKAAVWGATRAAAQACGMRPAVVDSILRKDRERD